MSKILIAGGVALALGGAVLAGPASAHHSYSMFDSATTLNLKATVVRWDWTNPHAYLAVTVDGQNWDMELASPAMISRAGVTRKSFKPGDMVTVTIHPRRDKTMGGYLLSVQTADGKVFALDAARQQLPTS